MSSSNTEIERKFLVRSLPENLSGYPRKAIRQWYLPTVRIREIGTEYKLTIKRGKGVVREEYEFNISKEEFDLFWMGTEGKRLEKTRYYIPYGSHTCELDEYYGPLSGLYTVEVEFDSLDAANAFVPPEWFGADVTDDERYGNGKLAKGGLPQ